MKQFEIGIIGGTHGMGKWFSRILESQGFLVHCSGRTAGLSVVEICARCSVVVISVPIAATADVIREVGPRMKKSALLMDLTSLKEEPVRLMLQYSPSAVIGCHPLFGPQMKTRNQNVVLCPVRPGRWRPWLKKVFHDAGANVTEADPKKHDEMMAVVQALNHLNNIAMGLVMATMNADVKSMENFTTPVFRDKKALLQKVFGQNPGLYAEIVAGNPEILRIIKKYRSVLAKLDELVRNKESGKLTRLMQQCARHLFPAG